ncbi:uncharacterized protein BDZ99DRAFT_472438 [Mytilinidion resinicola]|uniref:Uncharacterized protein n=1 Tax=Mytilinidion resinicola TaxID=574789 RepID=A0A6A6Z4B6_9PEZI|nr:uncharacterized protein BDZ99DRAFT_472438 [Mytilinidion resinicola]KAF2815097.1 hypothetical protein BDZ99DRAFT_472438 [Mytilinidion resinicola]
MVESSTSPKDQDEPYKLDVNVYSEPAPKRAWYKTLAFSNKAPEKETIPAWQDASLSDKERWKQWHKAKDTERFKNSTTGYYTRIYKSKYGWVWFTGLFGED